MNMETEVNISGISENLAESIVEQNELIGKQQTKSVLQGKRIAISVSESEELEQLGLSDNHLKDISIEIARYLIVNGAKMIYGGDLRFGGFTELFSDLSYQYKILSDKERRFINYFPFPNSKGITTDIRAVFLKKQVEVKILEIPKKIGDIDKEKVFKPLESVEDRFILSECFSDMRIRMANESDARILLGGKQKNYSGYFPGIVEEAYHSFKAEKPIYLLGGFGGATKSIIDIILGGNSPKLSNDFQFDSEFLKEFRDFAHAKSVVKLDYDYIVDFFRQHSNESISNQNGLSMEENEVLFESTNIHEIVFLILKGLQKIETKGK